MHEPSYGFAEVPLSDLTITRDDAHLIGKGASCTAAYPLWRGKWGTRDVAIKQMPYDASRTKSTELSVLQCGTHPNLLPLLGWSCDPDTNRFYVVVPLIQPGSLKQVMKDLIKGQADSWSPVTGGPLGWPRFLNVLLGLAHALRHLAHRRLTHRNIKPDNVLIDAGDNVVLADFGLGVLTSQSFSVAASSSDEPPHCSDSNTTHTSAAVAGTLNYMAPEAFEGRSPNPKMDMYSTGVLIWELYTGQTPRKGALPSVIPTLAMKGEPLPLPNETPEWLKQLIESCMSLVPQQRPVPDDLVRQLTQLHAATHRTVITPTAPSDVPAIKSSEEEHLQSKYQQALADGLEHLRAEKESLEQQLAQLKSDSKLLKDRFEKLQSENQRLLPALKAQQSEKEHLQRQLKELAAQRTQSPQLAASTSPQGMSPSKLPFAAARHAATTEPNDCPWPLARVDQLRSEALCGPDSMDHHSWGIFTLIPWPAGLVLRTAGDEIVIASGSHDRTIKFWMLESKRCIATISTASSVVCLAYVGHECVASGHQESIIKVWQLPHGVLRHVLRGHTGTVRSLTLAADNLLASAGGDKSIRLWHLDTGVLHRALENAHGHWVHRVIALHPFLVSVSSDKLIKVWRIPTGDQLGTLEGHTSAVRTVTPMGDQNIASGSDDGTIRIWNLTTLTCERIIEDACNGKFVQCMVSMGQWLFCSGGYDSTDVILNIRVWDATTGQLVRTLKQHRRQKNNIVESMLSLGDTLVVGETGWESNGSTPSIVLWR